LTNVQSKRTTRAEPEDHLWSADHSLRNAALHVSNRVNVHHQQAVTLYAAYGIYQASALASF